MNYSYKVYREDDPNAFDRHEAKDSRKIKNLVTVNITIELEEEKYNAKKAKYKEPIAEKIYKLFK